MPVPATALANAYYRHVASLFPFFMLMAYTDFPPIKETTKCSPSLRRILQGAISLQASIFCSSVKTAKLLKEENNIYFNSLLFGTFNNCAAMRYEVSSYLGLFQGIAINWFPRHNITKFLLKGFMSHGSAFYDLFQFGFFSFFRFFVVQSFVCKQLDIPVHRNIRNLGCQRFYHTVFKTFHDSVLRRFNLIFKFHSILY